MCVLISIRLSQTFERHTLPVFWEAKTKKKKIHIIINKYDTQPASDGIGKRQISNTWGRMHVDLTINSSSNKTVPW